MWRYDNVRFIYNNRVDSVYGQPHSFPYIVTYIKSNFELMQALRVKVEESFLGEYAEVDPKTVKFNKPYKV